jgi:two-component sensor histidine kinase
LELADAQIKKKGEFKSDLDSAAGYIEQASKLNSRVNSTKFYGGILIEKARLNRESGRTAQGMDLAGKAVQVLRPDNDHFLMAQAYLEYAEYYDALNIKQLPDKIKLIEKGIEQLRLCKGHVQLRASSLQFLADLYTFVPGDTKALKTLQQSLDDYKSIKYKEIQGVYDLFGRIYYNQRDFNNAIKYELMALQTAESLRDSSMQRCEINNTIGLIYLEVDEKEKAISYFINALKIAELHEDNNNIILLFVNISHAYVRINKAKEALEFANSIPRKFLRAKSESYDFYVPISYLNIYTALRKFPQAQHYCDQVIKILDMGKNYDNVRYNMLVCISRFYIESGNYVKALTYLKRNEALAKKLNDPMVISGNYRLWYRLDTLTHNYKSANEHFLRFFNIHDSLFNETKSRQIQQLRVQYETEKNQNEIKLKDQRIRYLNQSAKLQKAILIKTNLTKNIIIAATAILFIVTGLLYKQYRSKQSVNKIIVQINEAITAKNQVITQKNEQLESLVTEKEWLLKEVHHRVKNNLHMIICLLESQAAFLEDDALKAIEKSQNRIYTMSLIHQKLYLSGDLKTIEMPVYIPELVMHLKAGAGITDRIRFQFEIDHIWLDTSLAIPLALIINEAVTNSFKYAFPDNRNGEIIIALRTLDDLLLLELSDTGIGMKEHSVHHNPVSLGMELIKGLTKEIQGTFEIQSGDGVKIKIIFKRDGLQYSDLMDDRILSVS